ncbi:MAG: hypothetical protein U0228_25225 [Myxococcaceae bacterium]
MRRVFALAVLVLASTCEPVGDPTGTSRSSSAPLFFSAERTFDADTRTLAPTTGQQMGLVADSDGARARVLWSDGRQDPVGLDSLFTATFHFIPNTASSTILAMPSVSLPAGDQRELHVGAGDTLVTFTDSTIVRLDDAGVAEAVFPGRFRHLLTGPGVVLGYQRSSLGTLDYAVLSADGGTIAQASLPLAGTDDSTFTGAVSATQFAVAYGTTPLGGGTGGMGSTQLTVYRVPFDGGPATGPSVLATSARPVTNVSAASDGTNFAFAWVRHENQPDGGVNDLGSSRLVLANGSMSTSVNTLAGGRGPVLASKVCWDGTAWRTVSTERLSETNLVVHAQSIDPPFATPGPDVQIFTGWVTPAIIVCSSSGAAVPLWSRWNAVESGNAAVEGAYLASNNSVMSTFFPSQAGEFQSVSAISADLVTFHTPRGDFVAPADGRPDASVGGTSDEVLRATALPGDLQLWVSSASPTLSAEIRSPGGGLVASIPSITGSFDPAQAFDVVPWADGWQVAWGTSTSGLKYRRVFRDGGLSVQDTLDPGLRAYAAFDQAVNDAGVAVSISSDQVAQTVHLHNPSGNLDQAFPSAYFSQPVIEPFGGGFAAAWINASGRVAVTFTDALGQSDGGIVDVPGTTADHDPALACGPNSCLVAWVRSAPPNGWDIVGAFVRPGQLSALVTLAGGPNAELNPHLVTVEPSHWLLAFDRYEPALATRRAVVVEIFEAAPDAGVDAGIDAGMDAGIDAGIDAGVEVDAGGTDAGVEADAGVDAGAVEPDAGVVEPDAGSTQSDSGMAEPDAGSTPRTLTVGCGCSSSSAVLPFALALLLLKRRRA